MGNIRKLVTWDILVDRKWYERYMSMEDLVLRQPVLDGTQSIDGLDAKFIRAIIFFLI